MRVDKLEHIHSCNVEEKLVSIKWVLSIVVLLLSLLIFTPSFVEAKTYKDPMDSIAKDISGGKLNLAKVPVLKAFLSGMDELVSSPIKSAKVKVGVLIGKIGLRGKNATFLLWPENYKDVISKGKTPKFAAVILADGDLPLSYLVKKGTLGAGYLKGLSLGDALLIPWKGEKGVFEFDNTPKLVQKYLKGVGLKKEDEVDVRKGINIYSRFKIKKIKKGGKRIPVGPVGKMLTSVNIDTKDRISYAWVDLAGLGHFFKGKKPKGNNIAFRLSSDIGKFNPGFGDWYTPTKTKIVVQSEGGTKPVTAGIYSEVKYDFTGNKNKIFTNESEISFDLRTKTMYLKSDFSKSKRSASFIASILGLETNNTWLQIALKKGAKTGTIHSLVKLAGKEYNLEASFPIKGKKGAKQSKGSKNKFISAIKIDLGTIPVEKIFDILKAVNKKVHFPPSIRKIATSSLKGAAKGAAGVIKNTVISVLPKGVLFSGSVKDVGLTIFGRKDGNKYKPILFLNIKKEFKLSDLIPAGTPGRHFTKGVSFYPPIISFSGASDTLTVSGKKVDLPGDIAKAFRELGDKNDPVEVIVVGKGITLYSRAPLGRMPGVAFINKHITLEMPKSGYVSGSIDAAILSALTSGKIGDGGGGFSFTVPVKKFDPTPRVWTKDKHGKHKPWLTLDSPRFEMAIELPKKLTSINDLKLSMGVAGDSSIDIGGSKKIKTVFKTKISVGATSTALNFSTISDNKVFDKKLQKKIVKPVKHAFGLKWLDLANFSLDGKISASGPDFTVRGAARIGRKHYDVTAGIGAEGLPRSMRFEADSVQRTDLMTLVQHAVLGKEILNFDKIPQFRLLPLKNPSKEIKKHLSKDEAKKLTKKVIISVVPPGQGNEDLGLEEGVKVSGRMQLFGLDLADMYGTASDKGLFMDGKTASVNLGPLKLKQSKVKLDIPFQLGTLPKVYIEGNGPSILGSSQSMKLVFKYDDKVGGVVASAKIKTNVFGDSVKSQSEIRATVKNSLVKSNFTFVTKSSQKLLSQLQDGAIKGLVAGFELLNGDYNKYQKSLSAKLKEVEKIKGEVALERKAAQKRKTKTLNPVKKAQKTVDDLKKDIKHAKKQAKKYKDRYWKCEWYQAECQVKNSGQTNYWKSQQRILQGSYWTAWGTLEAVKKSADFYPIDADPLVAAKIIEYEAARASLRAAKVAVKGLQNTRDSVGADKWKSATAWAESMVKKGAKVAKNIHPLFELKDVKLKGNLSEMLKGGAGLDGVIHFEVLGEKKSKTLVVNPKDIGKKLLTSLVKKMSALSQNVVESKKSAGMRKAESSIPVLKPSGTSWQWAEIKGKKARDIGVGGDGSVWIVGTDYLIYKYDFKHNTWKKFTGSGQRISVDNKGRPWVVGANKDGSSGSLHYIYYWDGNKWVSTNGRGIDIDVGANGSVWALGDSKSKDTIWRWQKNKWIKVQGFAKRIAVGPNAKPWVVNRKGKIHEYVGGKKVWIKHKGLASDIGIGAEGSIWVIGGKDTIWYWDKKEITWKRINGKGAEIAVDAKGLPWVVDKNGKIWVNYGNIAKPILNKKQFKAMNNSLGGKKEVALNFTAPKEKTLR